MLKELDLKYRFGFLIETKQEKLNTSHCSFLNSWDFTQCGEAVIAHHHEAKISKFQFKDHFVFTLGDIFCAHGTENLENTLKQFTEENDWDAIDNLSGRFAILTYNKKNNSFEKILTDPIGSRTLFYSTIQPGLVASHSSLLAEILNINRDQETIEFTKSEDFLTIRTKFLPADLTMYKNIYGLPANHYYSFEEHKAIRFWPRNPIKPNNIENLLEISKEYLLKQIEYFSALGKRPVIGLTGGVDCRSIIAAWNSRKIHFKCLTWNRNLSNEEVIIIKKISSHLYADSYFLDVKKTENTEPFKALKNSGYINRGSFIGGAVLTAQTAEFSGPSDIFVRGLGGEILRGMFNKKTSKESKIEDGTYAINLYKTSRLKNPTTEFRLFVEKSYNDFFDRINLKNQKLFNYDFGDLIYWEQRMSMWAASLLNEADPALKNIAGLNSRKMYEAAYGLPDEERFQRELLLKITSNFDPYLANLPVT
ncbi:hypothetical protein HC956_15635 [Alcaligenes faecalis]|uniref:asparagine synthase (glutamine-hydrolyzing) n=1 Tax=Alcaligenes ammonioxydans TaxID=2582914 RepID=A0ABX8SW89_9BURK|nr:hypothetical protein [Alcaligenes ammonioxydans]QXX80310.1 hypothetical protein FE795_15650 [Alcaligenes ammonioxydans]